MRQPGAGFLRRGGAEATLPVASQENQQRGKNALAKMHFLNKVLHTILTEQKGSMRKNWLLNSGKLVSGKGECLNYLNLILVGGINL